MKSKGLDGVVAAETNLSMVDGEKGELVIAGFPVSELASSASFEETVFLLWYDALPDAASLAAFRSALAGQRSLPPACADLLREAASARVPPMDALRMATAAISLGSSTSPFDRPVPGAFPSDLADALRLVASFPTAVAAYSRLLAKLQPLEPRPELGHAANYLYMLSGSEPEAERVRGLETYLNTVVDHGFNASTFTARVIVSTESDFVSAATGALGALKGPLHGGAPGPALDMVFEIGKPENAEQWLRKKIESGEKLMGFGHRVYKVRDPRADVLAVAAERMFHRGGDMSLYELATSVERTALRLLEEYKPGRRLQTNVEFYTALLLHGIGLEVPLFTPTFAISRIAGWTAHCFEQRRAGKLIRPASEYSGPQGRKWTPIGERKAGEAPVI